MKATTDKQRFADLSAILSEDFIASIDFALRRGGRFSMTFSNKMAEYDGYQKYPSSHYDRPLIEKYFKKLNRAFFAFDKFCIQHLTAVTIKNKAELACVNNTGTSAQYVESIENLEKMNALFDAFSKAYKAFIMTARGQSIKASKRRKTLITRDDITGEFYCKGKRLRFNDLDDLYAKIFRILVEYADGDGFCSYDDIEKHLRRLGEENIIGRASMILRISNGVKSIFRYVDNLPRKVPGGGKLITTKRGNGLILHNP